MQVSRLLTLLRRAAFTGPILSTGSGPPADQSEMIPQAQVTLRNLSLLGAQRGVHILNALLFAAIVPRLMGPELYGQYALLISLAIWLMLFSGLGFTEIIGRHLPPLNLPGKEENLRKFISNLLTLRLITAVLAAGAYLLLTFLWLVDLDRWVLVIMAGIVAVRTVANLTFTYFLGLNQAARWGMDETLRRWLVLALLIPGFYLGSLRGACLGVLLAETTVLAVGLSWVRHHLSWGALWPDFQQMRGYLGFGLIFFAVNMIHSAFNQSGELLVRAISGDYVQVSYFGLANNVHATIAFIIPQFALAIAPLLSSLMIQGETEAIRGWMEALLKWLAVGGVLIILGVLFLGENLVPLVLGAAYRPVALNLLPLMLGLLTQALGSVGSLLALTFNRPAEALAAAGVKLAAFWSLGPILIAWWGSLGGCIAVLAASTLYAGYFTWRMRRVLCFSLRGYTWALGLGGLFLPLFWLRSSLAVNLGLFVAAVAAYLGLLFLLQVITPGDIAAGWRIISHKSEVWK